MQIDPSALTPSQIYGLMIRAITPRPIAWVSTLSPRGIPNLAPFSYFAGVGSNPASLLFTCVNRPDGTCKDTVQNLHSIPQFVVNVVPHRLAHEMWKTSADLDYEVSEFELTNLQTAPSIKITPPRVALSPIQMECEVLQIVTVGEGPGAANVVIGKVVWIDIDDDVLDSQGKIDPDKVDSIGRMGGKSYCRTLDRFEIS